MGPRPFSRGDNRTRCRWVTTSPRFNGAATFQSRRPAYFGITRTAVIVLQWGRDLSVAETVGVTVKGPDGKGASMGPRPFSRGDEQIDGTAPITPDASMGPRPFSRGDERRPATCPPARPCFNGAATFQSRRPVKAAIPDMVMAWLQWGRDLSVAETIRMECKEVWMPVLQWGRDLSVAETRA